MSTLELAIEIAARTHAGQVDKGGAPYILHPLRVMLRLTDPVARIVAVLHDVIEDTPVTLDQLRKAGFAPEVLTAVDALTKRSGESYDEFILRAGKNPIARLVKLADLEDNMDLSRIGDPTQDDEARLAKYRRAYALLKSMTAAKIRVPEDCLPTVLKISIGGYTGASYCVEWRDDHLLYSAWAWGSSEKPDREERIVPSRGAWTAFWETVDDINVWNWESLTRLGESAPRRSPIPLNAPLERSAINNLRLAQLHLRKT